MSDLVVNPKDPFSRVAAHFIHDIFLEQLGDLADFV